MWTEALSLLIRHPWSHPCKTWAPTGSVLSRVGLSLCSLSFPDLLRLYCTPKSETSETPSVEGGSSLQGQWPGSGTRPPPSRHLRSARGSRSAPFAAKARGGGSRETPLVLMSLGVAKCQGWGIMKLETRGWDMSSPRSPQT